MGRTWKSSNSLDIGGQRSQEGAHLPEPHPGERVIPNNNTAVPPSKGPPDSFHGWVILNWMSYCPPTPFDGNPTFPKEISKVCTVYPSRTRTRARAHTYI